MYFVDVEQAPDHVLQHFGVGLYDGSQKLQDLGGAAFLRSVAQTVLSEDAGIDILEELCHGFLGGKHLLLVTAQIRVEVDVVVKPANPVDAVE